SVLNVGRQTPTILITPATAAGRDVSLKSHLTGAPSEARPDTPFSSYDYDSDSDEKTVKGKAAYLTREIVISFD
ncbi:MAG TPA: hypothetical protein VGO47_12455, partial [Chlamydiales bacterium]|nr:hypothetical protein [Chlamydiales bacterium]